MVWSRGSWLLVSGWDESIRLYSLTRSRRVVCPKTLNTVLYGASLIRDVTIQVLPAAETELDDILIGLLKAWVVVVLLVSGAVTRVPACCGVEMGSLKVKFTVSKNYASAQAVIRVVIRLFTMVCRENMSYVVIISIGIL